MAWTFVGVSNVVEVATTSHALVTTGISGLQSGDLLVACISSRIASTTSVTLPTGGAWTLVGEQKANNVLTNQNALPSALMAYAIRGGSDPNLTFTHPTAPSVAIGRIVAYRNVNASSPNPAATAVTTSTNTTSVSVTGLTTVGSDALIVALAAGGQEAAWSSFNATSPSGASGATTTSAPTTTWQERQDSLTTTGADTSLAIFDAVKASAGATGNLTATASVAAAHVVIAGAFRAPYGDGTATGTGTAAATGAATASADASAGAGAGGTTATGAATAIAAGSGTATGTASATGNAVNIAGGVGSSSGTGAASAEGAEAGLSLRTVVSWVELSGTSSVTEASGVGAASGTGAASGVGAQISAAAGGASSQHFGQGHSEISIQLTGLEGGNSALAQSFSVSDGTLASVFFYISRSGTPDFTISAKIYAADGSHFPTGSQIGPTSSSIGTADVVLGPDAVWCEFVFPTPITLTPATQYVVVVERSNTGTGSFFLERGEYGYAGGQASRYIDSTWIEYTSSGISRDLLGYLKFTNSTATAVGTAITGVVGSTAGVGAASGVGAQTVAAIGSTEPRHILAYSNGLGFGIGGITITGIASSFTASGLLVSASFRIANSSATGDLTAKIYAADGSHFPTGAQIGPTVTVLGSAIPYPAALVDFVFSTPILLSPAEYVIVFERTATDGSFLIYAEANEYADGAFSRKLSGTWTLESGNYDAVGFLRFANGLASAVGAQISASAGAAAGAGAASGAGAAVFTSAGTAAGIGAAAGTGAAVAAGVGTATGIGAAAGTGAALTGTDASGDAAGTGAASAVGGAVAAVAGTAAGIGAAAGTGAAVAAGAGTAAGIGAAAGTGAAVAAGVGTATGVGSASGVGFSPSTAEGVGTAAGTGAAAGAGLGTTTGNGDGSAAGVGSASGAGTAVTEGVGTAAGTGAALATGASMAAGVGTADGVGTATGTGFGAAGSFGTAGGVGSALAEGAATAESVGTAEGAGIAVANGAGVSTSASAGSASGTGTALGVGAVVTYSSLPRNGRGVRFVEVISRIYKPAPAVTRRPKDAA